MGVEVDNLREDAMRMDDQLHRETSLRKSLQEEKKTLMAQAGRVCEKSMRALRPLKDIYIYIRLLVIYLFVSLFISLLFSI